MIIAQDLTDGNTDDARTALDLIDEVDGDMASLTADAAYDTIAIYDAAAARGATSFRQECQQRDRTDPTLAIARSDE
jgi:hypothetical protein